MHFLDAQAANAAPFYLSVHYTAPHSPWEKGQHPDELMALYKDCPFETCPEVPGGHPWQINSAPRGRGQKRRELLGGYYVAITGLDRGVGQLLDRLETLGSQEKGRSIYRASPVRAAAPSRTIGGTLMKMVCGEWINRRGKYDPASEMSIVFCRRRDDYF